jgi:hypothetical protein
MKQLVPILVLVCFGWSQAADPTRTPSSGQSTEPQASSASQGSTSASGGQGNTADENSRKAKAIIEAGIDALGGPAYLSIRDREQHGRGYTLHHGRSSGNGVIFWSFTQFPDKERVELTPERDVTELYIGNKGYEITYKGVHPIEEKDLTDYLRRRKFSLDTVLRTWVNDPGVILIYQGFANAAQHPADEVTLIDTRDESVTLDFDIDSHLPVRKSFSWRDPVDKQKNLEEEVYENYRRFGGVMVPYNVTRFFNGDMSSERFMFDVSLNQGLDQAMFDPNSGYNPNKPAKH